MHVRLTNVTEYMVLDCVCAISGSVSRLFFFNVPPTTWISPSFSVASVGCVKETDVRALSTPTMIIRPGHDHNTTTTHNTPTITAPGPYTHLRAHETVLELVFRLLLEKKKTTRNLHKHTDHSHNNQPHIIHCPTSTWLLHITTTHPEIHIHL